MQKYYFFANNDTTQHENMHRLRHIALKKTAYDSYGKK